MQEQQQDAIPLGFTPVSASSRFKPANPDAAPTEDLKKIIFELEEQGEWIVHRVPEPYYELKTKFGRPKKIPLEQTWHHKSCGQCGHIPGYSASIFWIARKLGLSYHNPEEQTSCTGWNYYASATSNAEAQVAVAARNFGQAYQDGYFPLIHCGTSYGHYKEVRQQMIDHPEYRVKARKIMKKFGKELVMPEEIVHYSEWVHALKDRIAAKKVFDLGDIDVSIHLACHYSKLVSEDALYSQDLYNGQRSAVVSGLVKAVGANLKDYSTFFDCCGFGFRHILVQRDFSRSFATMRKIEVMKNEANPDVVLTHDTGCVTTLDKSQFAARVHKRNVGVPVMSDAQFAALSMGAHPFRVVQLHWHSTDYRPLLEKMGIDHEAAWAEFQDDVKRIKSGEIPALSWEMIE
ncbi:MAG: heterodisulfide reductase-related iron-sulfur binding cluster [Candidatus Heimdallarchaeota archaeon]|nr:heterodisulfide reductase-related iron-sulfur binding cluster [Candidatus Heimdallarchaeota archaeon]MDH5646190.1 heterodisulfide reductase-related iron-sulfur binding cluster [Candidatus Heimdallarchaeota archaeon]